MLLISNGRQAEARELVKQALAMVQGLDVEHPVRGDCESLAKSIGLIEVIE